MQEKIKKRVKRGSRRVLLREARRQERLHCVNPKPHIQEKSAHCSSPATERICYANRIMLDLAWKTVVLMQRNTLIQQKLAALQKETAEFITTVLRKPENRQQYLEFIQRYALRHQKDVQANNADYNVPPVKIESDN